MKRLFKLLIRKTMRLFRKKKEKAIEIYVINLKYKNNPLIHDFLEERKAILQCNGYEYSQIYSEELPPTTIGEVKLYYRNELRSSATLRMRNNRIIWYFNEEKV